MFEVPPYIRDYVADLKEKERARSRIIDDLERRLEIVRRNWDDTTRFLLTEQAENVRLSGEVRRLAAENAGLRADAILRR